MTENAHPQVGGDTVAFRAHSGVIDALEQAAARQGVTRSHYARRLVIEYLRSEGWLLPDAPAINREARNRLNISN